jgi:hypothetical protein
MNEDEMSRNALRQGDHDEIVRLGAIISRAVSDVRDLHVGQASIVKSIDNLTMNLNEKIAAAVTGKADRGEVTELKIDVEKEHAKIWESIKVQTEQIQWLTKLAYGGLGIIGFIQLLISTGAIGK